MSHIVIYPGRFQPFHVGHYAVYMELVSKFGKQNVYICTSNKTDNDKSPFDFNDKQKIINTLFKIPTNRIVATRSPYRPIEILNKFNEDEDIFITCVGEKDADRLVNGKYYQPYNTNKHQLNPFGVNGYYYVSSIPGKLSGTDVREMFKRNTYNTAKKLFTKMYPTFNESISDLMYSKLNGSKN